MRKKNNEVELPRVLDSLGTKQFVTIDNIELCTESFSSLKALFAKDTNKPVRVNELIKCLHDKLRELDSISSTPDHIHVHNSAFICHWRLEDAIEHLIVSVKNGYKEFSLESLNSIFLTKQRSTNQHADFVH